MADAWHLWNNLAKAVEKTLTSQYQCLRPAHQMAAAVASTHPEPVVKPDGTLDVDGRPRRIVTTILQRHRAIHELLDQGRSLRGISRDLHLDYYAVRRYARTPERR
ncbi:hypothetical protein [Streptomyces sp. NPDC005283]|uniref:hypothetical protein n=1 Tax=Streptomyces sp. NPDC005283 TaxID=3156871 RepID=UPI003451FEC9